MGEHHDRPGALRQRQVPGQGKPAGVHLDRDGPRGGPSGRGVGRRPGQQGDDLLVGGLGEVPVPLADGPEGGRRGEAHHLVCRAAQPGDRVGRRHRDGQHHPGRALRPYDLARGGGGGAGGYPVVHHDHRPAAEGHPGPVAAEPAGLPGELRLLGVLDRRQVLARDPADADDVLADDPYAALTDGAEAELTMGGHTELADHDHVERRTEGPGHGEGHRDAAARQAQYDGMFRLQRAEGLGEPLAGVRAVGEVHGVHPQPEGRRKPRPPSSDATSRRGFPQVGPSPCLSLMTESRFG